MNLIEKIIEEKINRYGLWTLAISSVLSVFIVSFLRDIIVDRIWIMVAFDISALFYFILLVISWLSLIILILRIWELIKEKILWPIYLIFRYSINSIPRVSKWMFQGSLNIMGDDLEFTASNSGCLIKDYIYKDFLMSFDLKILNGGRAGIIFRAQNLENYLMLEIVLADTPAGVIIYDIIPWIRILGNWETFNITPEPFLRKDLDLQKDAQKKLIISNVNAFKVYLEVKNNTAILKLKSGIGTEEFQWNIPTHTEPNTFNPSKIGVPLRITGNENASFTSMSKDSQDGKFVPKVWFRNKYGRIGFRAHAWQIIRVNNLKIQKI